MNRIERIKQLVQIAIAMKAGKNQGEIGQLMGYTNPSAFSHVINGIDKEPTDFVDRLRKVIPNLNVEWIDKGVGGMFVDAPTPIVKSENNEVNGDNSPSFNVESPVNITEPRNLAKSLDIIEAQRLQNEKMQEKLFELINRIVDKFEL